MSESNIPNLVNSNISKSNEYKRQYNNCFQNQILYIKELLKNRVSKTGREAHFHSFEIYLMFLLSEIYLKQSFLRLPNAFSSFSDISLFFKKTYKHNLHLLLEDCDIDSVVENRKRDYYRYLRNQIESNNYENNINQYCDLRYGTSLGGASKYNSLSINMEEMYEYIRRI